MPRPPAKAQALADTLAVSVDGLPADTWLVSERELAAQHGVDRSTVRRALQILESRGRIILIPGVGAQVGSPDTTRRDTADITTRVRNWRGFHVSATRAGRQPYTETAIRDIELDTTTARWLGVPTGTRVLERTRRQGVRGEPPVQLSTTWILPEVVDRLPILRQVNTGPGGMLSRMEEQGYRLRFEDVVTCRLPEAHEQHRLEIDADEPVLDVWRRCYDQTSRVVEVTRRVIVGDRHELVYNYDADT